jgi:hypothetical protein
MGWRGFVKVHSGRFDQHLLYPGVPEGVRTEDEVRVGREGTVAAMIDKVGTHSECIDGRGRRTFTTLDGERDGLNNVGI